jgi:A/G-specific adenine glycosylase
MPGTGGIAQRVLRWRLQFGRQGLPWQDTKDPYRVWLSEIMLQQTQVATVRDYYARFLQRFPDLAALAAAPQDEVLALWSGLGYYSRARNLHRCAQVVQREHGGVFPDTSQALAQLPGIGRSTAAAIAAFCFGERVAILDGNVKRVLGRALGFAGDLSWAAQERALWQRAQELVPEHGVEHYTQGLMDLGATLCSVRKPACERCPLATLCVARREGRPEAYPVKTRRLKRGARAHAWLWLSQAGRLWLVQRPEQGVWAGLWSLPEFDTPEALQQLLQGWPGRGTTLPTIEHALTHFDWTLLPLRWQLPARLSARRLEELTAQLPQGRWVSLEQALQMGLPAPLRKLLSR